MYPQNPHPFQIQRFETCDSTNHRLLEAAEAGASNGLVYVTRQQLAGRGRRGRQWIASPGTSLTCSLLWVFPPDPARLQGLSLLVGLAVVRALETRAGAIRKPGITLGLKWPNDLLIRRSDGTDAKAGGILIESAMRRGVAGARELAVVIGIGLNCIPDTSVSDAVDYQPVGALSELFADPVTPDTVLQPILETLTQMLGDFAVTGFAPYAKAWNAHNLWQGQPVEIREDNKVLLQGRCEGVAVSGALRVSTPSSVEEVISGDVSLRRV